MQIPTPRVRRSVALTIAAATVATGGGAMCSGAATASPSSGSPVAPRIIAAADGKAPMTWPKATRVIRPDFAGMLVRSAPARPGKRATATKTELTRWLAAAGGAGSGATFPTWRCPVIALTASGDGTLGLVAPTAASSRFARSATLPFARLRFVPQALAVGMDSLWMTAPGSSTLRRYSLRGTSAPVVVAGRWGGVRALVGGGLMRASASASTTGRYIYTLGVDGSLRRWADIPGAKSLVPAGTISESGWRGVRAMSFARTEIGPGRQWADVMIVTTKTGELREYLFPHAAPGRATSVPWATVTLQKSGWATTSYIGAQPCVPRGTESAPMISALTAARAILTQNSDAAVRLRIDRVGADLSGLDIGRPARMGAWPVRIFAL